MIVQVLDNDLVGLQLPTEERPEKDVAIWDFAFSKFPSDKVARERLVANVYSAFWKGEFAPDGLTLLYDVKGQSDPGVVNGLSRVELAKAALGEEEFVAKGVNVALETLALWNMSNYRNILDARAVYRQFFCPEDGISGHKRGLYATEDVLETWYGFYVEPKLKERPSPNVQSSAESDEKPHNQEYVEEHEIRDWFAGRVGDHPKNLPFPNRDDDYKACVKHFKPRKVHSKNFYSLRAIQGPKGVVPLAWRKQGRRSSTQKNN